MVAMRKPVDPQTLADHIGYNRMTGAFNSVYLFDLWQMPVNWTSAPGYAAKIHDDALKRGVIQTSIRMQQLAYEAVDTTGEEIIGRTMGELDALAGGELITAELEDPRRLAADTTAIEHRWVVPHLLGAEERVIVVGWEGHGKTLLSYQVGFTAAAGLHPFRPSLRIPPVRVLIVDLEVPRGIRARNVRRLMEHADRTGIDTSMIRLWSRTEGLDLRTPAGQLALSQAARKHFGGWDGPCLLVLGPLYKCGIAQGQAEGSDYLTVATFLSRLSRQYGFAMWLEQHAPMGQPGRARLLRPLGSVLWQQWPEFGWGLQPKAKKGHRWYALHPFRDPRETGRDWPDFVYWRPPGSFGWPWAAEYGEAAFQDDMGIEVPAPPDPVAEHEAAQQDRRDELAERRLAAAGAGGQDDDPPF